MASGDNTGIQEEETELTEPALVFWRVGEKPEPKEITVIAASSVPIPAIRVNSDNTAFKTNLKTLTDGQTYVITVTPESTANRKR